MKPETPDRRDSLPLSVAERIDEVCTRFEAAWQNGQPRLEEFLGAAEGPEREALLRELLRVELDYRCQGGSVPAVEDYLSRFPGYEPLLRAEIESRAARAAAGGQPPIQAAVGTVDDALKTGPHVGGPDPEFEAAIAGYEILEELGKGGMGIVYKARQIKANRLVALKMIKAGEEADPEERARFRTEAEAVARLQHPNIVQVFDVAEHDGVPYFSLEFCPGGSLDRKLQGNPLSPIEAAKLTEPLARAMHAAHQKGVLHRDLKPANVLFAEDGTPKVTDFGLAKKLEDSGQTREGTVMGTPSYMPPEQAAGRLADVGPAAAVRTADGSTAVQGGELPRDAASGAVRGAGAAVASGGQGAGGPGDGLSEVSAQGAFAPLCQCRGAG